MPFLEKALWPEFIKSFNIPNVFIGGCYERGDGSKFRAKAHAHFETGIICFRSSKWLHVKELWLHEIAHVLTKQGHTDKWRKKLIEIGGTLEAIPGILYQEDGSAYSYPFFLAFPPALWENVNTRR